MANVDLMVLAGDYVKTAVISNWKVKVGDVVKKGDVLLEVETNKLVQAIESPCDGIVEQILFTDGDDVEISKTVAVIGDGSGTQVAPADDKAAAAPASGESKEDRAQGGRVVISPVAKKMAKEKGIDLDDLARTFPGKRIGKEDVLEYESAKSLPAATNEATEAPVAILTPIPSVIEKPVEGMRRAVATAMRNSAYGKPHVTLMADAKLDEMLKFKDYLKKKYPDRRVTITGLIALAVRSALKECPYMNGQSTEEMITLHCDINLGIAVDVEGGLMVPNIKNTNALSGLELFEAVNAVSKGCREGSLKPCDYAGGTFTITNIGSQGVKYFTPIINPPEIAILGVGATTKELAIVDGEIVEQSVIGLSLSFDHAAIDGAPAGKFLKILKEKIEYPFTMAL